ncbi:MAG: nucleotide exchange factor GrpE [Stygiobacter sp. RIFOXYC12_FULL_38_8]|nr:MAG: nucleotide exchange factor GrpE [Stygiobacter sp. GWC2_38_9]OGV07257.1 MAG: nucleotide exchange factor GrpE [Stygiobacter sp. RIFOXYB2_FULL_37_11]OGV14615.1 MAG: nucleotide exchange factor GrpE [Stygiobacter sp. RIFOXYC2_FULL_38_25]OGV29313.1 MAG: nucleotide exchange factor GrpE [Stygiobacter sp. RIFOXYC12_FULL_38_8]OGV81486.1 MAG: nucleotide exchange factor GrpE [Stygiobacter sp. GWF2_38_21]
MKDQNDITNQEDNSIPIERVEKKEDQVQEQEPDQEKINNEEILQGKIVELEKQTAELKDSLLRKVAEFENYKRRNENEQMNLLKYAAEPFIKSVLSVYDDLERSLSHIDDENSFESTKKGLQLVFDKFNKTLDAQGVKKIEAKGQPFDVHFHEALMQQPVEGVAPHTVLDVIEPGYLYKDKVIRHAKVIVSAELASPETDNTNQEG